MIYLLCSTIRPSEFKKAHMDWVAKADSIDNVTTKLIVDTEADKQALDEFDVTLYTGDSVGITKPLYQLTSSLTDLNDDDIIVVMSDDFYPPEHWDTFLLDQFKDFSGVLSVFDGGGPNVQKTIVTIPIMDYKTLKRLNMIVYHPAYTHMYSDNELHDNAVEMNMIRKVDPALGYTFDHRHWTKGTFRGSRPVDKQDAILDRISKSHDVHLYESRKKLPLEERLKV